MKFISNSKERLITFLTYAAIILVICLPFALLIGLCYKSGLIIENHSIAELLTSEVWRPNSGQFGLKPFIYSSVWITVIAMLISTPICIFSAIHLSQYAPKPLFRVVRLAMDILAGIPSVVYGIWGIMLVVPFVGNVLAPAFGFDTMGYSILSAAIVLAIMVVPFVLNMMLEIYRNIPTELSEVSLSLGASKWETIKFVLNRKALPGLLASIGFGFSRAFGETMAVLMVVGSVAKIPESVFDPGYTLPAMIANTYNELGSVPEIESTLMFAALILFFIVLLFNAVLRWFIIKTDRY